MSNLKAAEIRQKLIDLGQDEKYVSGLSKTAALALLNSQFALETESDIDDEVENINESMEYDVPPSITDPSWTEYCLSLLDDEEIEGGVPKVDGLRRLVEQEISPIASTSVEIQTLPGSFNTVIATATIQLKNGYVHQAAADAQRFSVGEQFQNRLTAMADTRS